ncbi:MAG: excinuclease ABC subunit UvrB [Myxococcota bacterium]|nr:excinuclease ABC subunit UvrB [Myxococcota bacterium]
MPSFRIQTKFTPSGDQPKAIAELLNGLNENRRHQILLGATGTGKTFSLANVIAQAQKPTLILAHNKTLAAQLYGEMRHLFPDNAVEYFVSYYDYYQPEAYVPSTDNYIPKESQINEQIDKLRHSATRSLLERNDVIIVSSVSCIYGLGSKEAYDGMLLILEEGGVSSQRSIITKLVDIFYERNDFDFHRGTFRVRGDVIEVFPAYEDEKAIRIELFDDEVERISWIDPLRGQRLETIEKVVIYPASHYVTPPGQLEKAVVNIRMELGERLQYFLDHKKLIEAQRLEERTRYDLEMLEETGRCRGIENYSRHLSGREPGDPPPTLLEYFPKDWLLIVDESHVTIPQVRAMYKGDQSRKKSLVDFGFRLPSAMDNRPLAFHEFNKSIHQIIYVSATPASYELEKTDGEIVEQLIRPTGLLDPQIYVRPQENQVDDLFDELKKVIERKERALVTTMTKRMAQELTSYYADLGLRVRYLHSDIDTLERVQIITDLRKGEFDILIGINLLREGLDIPEVSLVAILDADKEGFLRNRTSLIQTIGRAARNVDGYVILYADRVTDSMAAAIEETQRRRSIQQRYNQENGIVPRSISKSLESPLSSLFHDLKMEKQAAPQKPTFDPKEVPKMIVKLRKEMKEASKALAFEKAAVLRDQIKELELYSLRFT